jgi:hypothetical protein
MIVKDYGDITESITLYKRALDLQPSNSAYCLNLIHTMEIYSQYQEIFTIVKTYCQKNKSLAAGTLNCGHILSVIDTVKTISLNAIFTGSAAPVNRYDPTQLLISEALDLLAIFFTLVKIVYVVGFLQVIPPLVDMIGKLTLVY